MEESTFGPSGNYYEKDAPKGSRKFLRLLIIFIIVVAVGFAAFSYFGLPGSGEPEPTPTPTQRPTDTPLPTVEPSPTEGPTGTVTPTGKVTPSVTPRVTAGAASTVDKATGLDRSDLSVEVQNGSGVAGAGAKAGDYLEELGYEIGATGNADAFDYTNVTISVKSTFSKYLPLLKADLAKEYTVGTTDSKLAADSDADALVIIGK